MTLGQPADSTEYVMALQAAIESVKKDVRGLPRDAAELRLIAALRAHDVFLPADDVSELALQMSDPWWPLRHPVRSVRRARSRRVIPDTESARMERESVELGRRLDDIRGVRTFTAKRTVDGMVYAVTLDPWSEQLAARVRAAAVPYKVDVKPAT